MTQSLVNRFVGSSQFRVLPAVTAARAVLAITATSLLLPVLVASQARAGGGDTPSQKPSSQPTPRTLRPTPDGATTVKAVRTEGVEIKPRHKNTIKAVVKTTKPTPTVAKTAPLKSTKKVAESDTLVIRAPRAVKQTKTAPVVPTRASRAYAANSATGKRTAAPPVRRSTKTLTKAVKSPIAPVVQVYPPYRKTVPRGSYVGTPVRTNDAVYRQAITRPAILQRYQYAWKTSPQETLQRLRGLKLTQLQQTGVYRVYYTRANGAWGYKIRTVPTGTWVYSLPDTARPLMLQVCGNPVDLVPPALVANKPPVFSPLEPDTNLILDTPSIGLVSDVSALPGLPTVLGDLSTPSAFAGTVGGVAPGLIGGGIGSTLGLALPVGLGLASVIPHSRLPINGTVIGGQVINNVGPNVTPVPEPSGFVFAGTLITTLGAALGRPLLAKRKRRQNA